MTNLRSSLIFTLAVFALIGCGKRSDQNPSAEQPGIESLVSQPGCRSVFESEEYNYKKFENFQNVEAGAVSELEFLSNQTVVIKERFKQCAPGQGPFSCQIVHADPVTTTYMTLANGFLILDAAKNPSSMITWDAKDKKGMLTSLTFKMDDLFIGKNKLEVTVKTCKH